MRYQLHWKAIKRDATGHANYTFNSQERAQSTADKLNAQYSGLREYWVKKVPGVEVMKDGLSGDWLGLKCAIGPCMDCPPLTQGKCDNS